LKAEQQAKPKPSEASYEAIEQETVRSTSEGVTDMAKKVQSAKTSKRRVKVKDMSATEQKLSARQMKKVKGGATGTQDAMKRVLFGAAGGAGGVAKPDEESAQSNLTASARDANLFS
jgi:hypothetical protein